MNRYNILKKELDIHSNKLLEASAGTGKTFSIENLVVRLLLESDNPFTIDKILIVTFTRMATRDLKKRVRENIECSIQRLEEDNPENYEYLTSFLYEEGERTLAIRRLERALLGFDEAQIFTIHGFCSRMLSECGFEGNVKVDNGEVDQGIQSARILRCVRDYFRTGISEEEVGPAHLEYAINQAKASVEKLERLLVKVLESGIDVISPPSYVDLFESFSQKVQLLKDEYGVTSEKIAHDFELLSSCYTSVCNQSGNVKPEVLVKMDRFLKLFENETLEIDAYNQLVKDKLYFSDTFVPENRKKRGKHPESEQLHLPNLVVLLQEHIQPLLYPNLGIGRIAAGCQQLMRHQLNQEEQMGYDDLLVSMTEGLNSEDFVQKIRSRYQAVIVDEFQDTDPRQWEIFKRIFPPDQSGWGHLYLVGDPKQSIYAFRQADIYTYLEAAALIGQENIASLDTNFRSDPKLVSALNHLFTTHFEKGWMPLPKNNTFLEVPHVKWRSDAKEMVFNDTRGVLHFFVKEEKKYNLEKLEEEAFFPFIVQEIERIHKELTLPLKDFAVLVSDRYQAKRIGDFLKEWGITSHTQRTEPLTTSVAVTALRELLYAILHFRNESSVKLALGGHFTRWTHDEVVKLDDVQLYESVQSKFQSLRILWKEEGLAVCLNKVLTETWKQDDTTALELILTQEGGEQFYSDYQQILQLLLEKKQSEEESIETLDQLLEDERVDDPRLKRQFDPNRDAVQILTLHASKGLEFGVVFALGLIKRTKDPELFYPSENALRLLKDRNESLYQEYLSEINAEKMRQLYVALTRAKYRLYCPVAQIMDDKQLSPMELFINAFNTDFNTYVENAKEIESITHTPLNTQPSVVKKLESNCKTELIEPSSVNVLAKPVFVHSFSFLSQKKSHQNSLLNPPHDFQSESKTIYTLPSGSETGTLLHQLLEEIPFHYGLDWKSPQDALPFVLPYIEHSEYLSWKDVLAEIVYYAVKTPLINNTPLQSIDPNCCDYESEFLFKKSSQVYIKGFIDLIFFHEGKYYLLDWKSNWIGNESQHYSPNAIDKAMKEHDYYFQAEIYTDALARYLALIEKKPFDELFGGVFYIFLRGLPDHGIIHFSPAISTH